MMMALSPFSGFLVLLAGSALAQDMIGDCVGCGDIYRKCELTCLRPRSSLADELPDCISECKATLGSCSNSEATNSCLSCVESCTMTYETEMLECLQKVEPTTTFTFNRNLDACSVDASRTMDTCTASCYGDDFDPYEGWTPDKEEGVPNATGRFSISEYLEEHGLLETPARRKLMARPKPTFINLPLLSAAAGLVALIAGVLLERRASSSSNAED